MRKALHSIPVLALGAIVALFAGAEGARPAEAGKAVTSVASPSKDSSKKRSQHSSKQRGVAAEKGKTARHGSAVEAKAAAGKLAPPPAPADEVSVMRDQLNRQQELLAAQQQQLTMLRQALDDQKQLLESAMQGARAAAPQMPNIGQVASLAPAIPNGTLAGGNGAGVPAPAPKPAGSGPQESTRGYVERVDQLSKNMDKTLANLAGFKFSGDFRLRFDSTDRSSNKFAGPAQNTRGNYRMRFNVDKPLTDQLSFHFQLGSGLMNNPLTANTDFGGFATRGPIFLSEAWGSYHPNSSIDLLGGRIPELFADDSRFLFKEDIRFDGFQENFKIPVGSNPLGITRIEVRGGQYILTNPNIQVLPSAKACTPAPPQVITKLPATIITPAPLPANCAYLNAGYLPGQSVRDADLFHQGFALYADLKPGWHHQFGGDLQWYRNQNQIALAATTAGAPVVIGAQFGTTSISAIPGTGTATTTPGGAMFTAQHFQVAHLKYRIGYDGWKIGDHEMPIYLEFHGARNVGIGYLNNAVMGLVSFGDVKKVGDVRLLYAYGIKEANSMISEVTDDYLGTNSGVNMRTHEIRVDVGLSRFLAWQNLFFIQNEISGNNAARNFYVPLQPGAATQYRLQSQLQFKF